MLEIKNLYVSMNGKTLLENINLVIEDNSRLLSDDGSTWTHARESEGNESDSQLLQNAKRDLSPEDYRLVIALIKRLREK